MEPKTTWLGSSLLVPCVKELVAQQPATVPHRYVRPEVHLLSISSSSDAASKFQVPVIDMHRCIPRSPWIQSWRSCTMHAKTGDFSSFLVKKMKKEIQEFFNLPMEEKKKYWQQEGDMEGFGQAFVVSEEQKLDWGDMFYMLTLPARLRKPIYCQSFLFHSGSLFLSLPIDTVEAYSSELEKLATKILGLIAKVLRIDPNYMRDLFEGGFQAMRMNYYPPCPQPDLVIGLSAHSDAVALTILLQVNEMEGLQIKKDGNWVPIKPLPNAFIINIGDILEILTNGIYRSIEHRATVNSDKERLSIATFYNPRLDGKWDQPQAS
ncbi:hypothetical protein GH714_004543 [Hevea brasiliensis]|uniref:Fe2OG dioxygenase domain-containing protein n=1 Tax=Hevea brasiliensis TaxID=3981 RepID=A0A6A6LV89_HEVBR|nr:hypothetical protein GH714_004543 [Hevea brasiliensis]